MGNKRKKCPILGCRCFERYPFSYYKKGLLVEPVPERSEREWILLAEAREKRHTQYLKSRDVFEKKQAKERKAKKKKDEKQWKEFYKRFPGVAPS